MKYFISVILFGNTSPYDIYLELDKCLNHQKKFSSGLKMLKRNDMYVHTRSQGRADSSLVPQAGRTSASSSSVKWGENNVMGLE